MNAYSLTAAEKQTLKNHLKGYRRMTRSLKSELEALGIRVEYSKNHVKLYYNDRLYIAPSTASDWRAGANLASLLCREF